MANINDRFALTETISPIEEIEDYLMWLPFQSLQKIRDTLSYGNTDPKHELATQILFYCLKYEFNLDKLIRFLQQKNIEIPTQQQREIISEVVTAIKQQYEQSRNDSTTNDKDNRPHDVELQANASKPQHTSTEGNETQHNRYFWFSRSYI